MNTVMLVKKGSTIQDEKVNSWTMILQSARDENIRMQKQKCKFENLGLINWNHGLENFPWNIEIVDFYFLADFFASIEINFIFCCENFF